MTDDRGVTDVWPRRVVTEVSEVWPRCLMCVVTEAPPVPWNECTCSAAALGGHLELLKWARAPPPPSWVVCPFRGWV